MYNTQAHTAHPCTHRCIHSTWMHMCTHNACLYPYITHMCIHTRLHICAAYLCMHTYSTHTTHCLHLCSTRMCALTYSTHMYALDCVLDYCVNDRWVSEGS